MFLAIFNPSKGRLSSAKGMAGVGHYPAKRGAGINHPPFLLSMEDPRRLNAITITTSQQLVRPSVDRELPVELKPILNCLFSLLGNKLSQPAQLLATGDQLEQRIKRQNCDCSPIRSCQVDPPIKISAAIRLRGKTVCR